MNEKSSSIVIALLGAVGLALVPVLAPPFYASLLISFFAYGIALLGFNLLFGYSGLHSFGHGAYLGVGAYAFGLFQKHVDVSLGGGLLAAVLAAGFAGAVVGTAVSHRRGIYYALMTIAFGQVFWFAAMKLHWLTGGEDGLLNIPRPPVDLGIVSLRLDDNVALYAVVATVLSVMVVLMWRLVNSPYGRVLQAIRQNETRAAFVGYDVWWYKWSAFVISAMCAGLAS